MFPDSDTWNPGKPREIPPADQNNRSGNQPSSASPPQACTGVGHPARPHRAHRGDAATTRPSSRSQLAVHTRSGSKSSGSRVHTLQETQGQLPRLQPMWSPRPQAQKGLALALMLCCLHPEILSNREETRPRFHVALGHRALQIIRLLAEISHEFWNEDSKKREITPESFSYPWFK